VSRILFYAINGIGLGHVARLSVVAKAVQRRYPSLDLRFHSNSRAAPDFFGFAGTVHIPLAGSASDRYTEICQSFDHAIAVHQPDVVVCDTHWPENITAKRDRPLRRAIVLRMPDAASARDILPAAAGAFDCVLLPHLQEVFDDWLAADPSAAPLISRSNMYIIGPLARTATPPIMRRPHVLFLLGGGGSYGPNAPSVPALVDRLFLVARALRQQGIRSQIVKGPFMQFHIPRGPWDIVQTYNVPKYIDERTVVVARPSYNSCWETIAAGARLVIVGEHNGFHEDAIARAKWFESVGLATRADDDIAGVVMAEIDRGWDPDSIRRRGAVNAGLPVAVERLVQLAKEAA
jgi:UDP-N-acetylglucosamine--N-acetylmuramyl-(pentapeptide) pyrophosphoryl-undecaprenol N-acetylglucosamine transferase